ncbi:class I SAM-dependent methyltransferase [Bosea sp. F3-2]|uniref:methyltransferase domain-containing protein n=1 Tax=Bosea sp. F3-2 TaxID=2599640 RepID=UPI0020BE8302|nr:class I SAM-dependent methyltransferase [Bosea sp. F3-2]
MRVEVARTDVDKDERRDRGAAVPVQTLAQLVGQLPAPLRKALRRAIGGQGHAQHWTHALWAWHRARGDKRVDRIAPGLAALIRDTCGSVEGLSCLEFGSGHLLSEALVFWLAGATRVVAVDYYPLLRLHFARRAFTLAGRDALLAALAPVASAATVTERIARLDQLGDWTLEGLSELGIDYLAPADFCRETEFAGTFDLIHSASVLEHLPLADSRAIVANTQAALRPGGLALHAIHLEDHLDFRHNPLAFLAADTDWREGDADARGNRLRASDWLRIFRSLPAAQVEILWEVVREDAPLPRILDPVFAGYAERDLRIGGIMLAVRSSAWAAEAVRGPFLEGGREPATLMLSR